MRLLTIDRVIDKGLTSVTGSLSTILLFIMAVIMFIEVISRYVFGAAHGQVIQYCILFSLWISFLMIGIVTKQDKHIVISLLPRQLVRAGRPRAKAALDIYISITLVVFGAVFLHWGVLDTANYIASGIHYTLEYTPYYWTRHLALPVGSVILIYYGIRGLIQNIRYLCQPNRSKEVETR